MKIFLLLGLSVLGFGQVVGILSVPAPTGGVPGGASSLSTADQIVTVASPGNVKQSGVRITQAVVQLDASSATGSATGGIKEAYAACPSTGCTIRMGANVTISTPQTITITSSKPFVLDMNNFSITAALASTGTALTIKNPNRVIFEINNGQFTCSGAAAGVTALSIGSYSVDGQPTVYARLSNNLFYGCATAGTTALFLDAPQETYLLGNVFLNNATPLLSNQSTTINLTSNGFQGNSQPIDLIDSSGILFIKNEFQGNTGTHALKVEAVSTNVQSPVFINNDWEANGDGTSASDALYLNAAMGTVLFPPSLVGVNTFNGGSSAQGGLGVAIRWAGAGTHTTGVLDSNRSKYLSFASTFGSFPAGLQMICNGDYNTIEAMPNCAAKFGIAGLGALFTKLYITSQTPASSSAQCTIGQIAADTGFMYFCISTDTWKRVAIATW